MALGYAWFGSYDSVGYVLTLHIFPPIQFAIEASQPAPAAAVHPETDFGGALDMGDRARTSSK